MKSAQFGEPGDRRAHTGEPIIMRGVPFLVGFGGVWLLSWAAIQRAPLTGLAIVTIAIAAMAWSRARPRVGRGDSEQLESGAHSATRRSIVRLHRLQWTAVLGVSGFLGLSGHPDFIVPSIILVIGLHFLPLARILRFVPYGATGVALMLVGAAGLQAAAPSIALSSLCTGLVLWATAAYVLAVSRCAGGLASVGPSN
jgi:hypothetical protein